MANSPRPESLRNPPARRRNKARAATTPVPELPGREYRAHDPPRIPVMNSAPKISPTVPSDPTRQRLRFPKFIATTEPHNSEGGSRFPTTRRGSQSAESRFRRQPPRSYI